MKVYVFPADAYGCGHYRLIWPARVLRQLGYNVVVRMPHERHELKAEVQNDTLVDVQVPPDADVIVMQRVSHLYLVQAIPLIRERYGCAVVIDMDDDLLRIHPSNPAFAMMHPNARNSHPKHSWANALRACEAATLVTVSTPALVPRYAPHGRAAVVRNRVPRAFLEIEHADSDVIGWGGSVHSHPDDPHEVGPAIARLVAEGYKFKIVGPQVGAREAFQLLADPEVTGTVDIDEWPRALAANLGVGVAPLTNTAFNEAKSWLKPLEYASAGVPSVMSPRAEYRKLHLLGLGVLAAKPKDWYRELRRLATAATLRQVLGGRAREVASRLTIEGGAELWWRAWSKAYEVQRGGLEPRARTSLPPGYALFGSRPTG